MGHPWPPRSRGHRQTSFLRPSIPRPHYKCTGAAGKGAIALMSPRSGSRHKRAWRTSSATRVQRAQRRLTCPPSPTLHANAIARGPPAKIQAMPIRPVVQEPWGAAGQTPAPAVTPPTGAGRSSPLMAGDIPRREGTDPQQQRRVPTSKPSLREGCYIPSPRCEQRGGRPASAASSASETPRKEWGQHPRGDLVEVV